MRTAVTLAAICLALCSAPARGQVWTGSEVATDDAASVPVTAVLRSEITFHNAGATLRGTLYKPVRSGPLPALVVTHGASSPSRHLPLYAHLAEMLPQLGMAVFIYDRRGSGESGGSLRDSDYAILAQDAVAARNEIARDPDLDAARIGYWGLSQGGWLAMLAAAEDPDAAFAVSVSAPFVTPDVQMMHATESILRIRGYDRTEIDIALQARAAVDAYLRGEMDARDARPRLARAVSRPWFSEVYMRPELEDPATSRWLKEMNHDPLAVLSRLTAPTLVLYGDADPWIPVNASIAALAGVPETPGGRTVVVLPGVDHSMMTSATPGQQVDPAFFPLKRPDSAAYLGVLATWLVANGLIVSGPASDAPGVAVHDP